MKKLNLIKKASFVIGLSLFTLFANAKTKNGNELIETEKTIKESIVFITPVSSQKVEILFTTSEAGNVNFVLAKTEDSTLKTQIEKQFIHLHLSNLKADVVYSIILNFKTL
ncbi:MAG: hypothetical protein SFY56_12315 [Bacteroidota bacterium]|nr:hypothetical protein [Bacteroidota bacterium]